jgi:hypothetical protein
MSEARAHGRLPRAGLREVIQTADVGGQSSWWLVMLTNRAGIQERGG